MTRLDKFEENARRIAELLAPLKQEHQLYTQGAACYFYLGDGELYLNIRSRHSSPSL